MTTPVYPNAISFADLKTEFGASNNSSISLSNYYAGGSLIPSGTVGRPQGSSAAIPTSGALGIDQLHGTTHPGYTFASSGNFTYNIPYGITKLHLTYWDMSGNDVVQVTATPACTPGGTVTLSLGSDSTQHSTLDVPGYGTVSLPVLRKNIVRMQGNVDNVFEWYISLHASGGNTSGSGQQAGLASVVNNVGGSISFGTENSHGQLNHSIYYYPVNSSYIDAFSSRISDGGFQTFVDAFSYRNASYPPGISRTPSKSNGYSLGCFQSDQVADEGYNDVAYGVYLPNYLIEFTPLAA